MKDLIPFLSLPEVTTDDFTFVRITNYYDGILEAECLYNGERALLHTVYDGHGRQYHLSRLDDCEWMEYDRRKALYEQYVATTKVEWETRTVWGHRKISRPKNKRIAEPTEPDSKKYWALAQKWRRWPKVEKLQPVARFSFYPSPHLRRARSIRYWQKQ